MNALSSLWSFDPDVVYLNHGSFGACPSAVLDFQAELRRRIEREPFRFFARDLEKLLDGAREEIAALLGAAADDLAFVPNATTGINTVLRGLELGPGDEILTTDHAYNACRAALEFTAVRTGARIVTARVPFPLADEEEIVEAVFAEATGRTRLALLDHVTSATALVFPIAKLVAHLRSAGVETVVDGAHAPGMVPLDLDRIGAAYYAGNAHKWLCAPKGAAFLHVRRDRQDGFHPLTISHGYDAVRPGRSRFRLEFDWTGTCDPTACLSIPEAVRFLRGLFPGGMPGLMARNRALTLEARRLLCEALGVPVPCPAGMIGAMASVPLPAIPERSDAAGLDPDALTDLFFDRYRIETWLYDWPRAGSTVLRVAAQAYNDEEEFRRLAGAAREILWGPAPGGDSPVRVPPA